MQKILCCTRYSILQKLSNKQSAKVICKCDGLRTAHRKPYGYWKRKLIAAHAFDYIVLKVNPGLTSCEDLATALPSVWEKSGS